ncbi:hypothetical protein [Novosphingobium album (ex Liu et al. 2023)]|uniref:DUF2892 domain-containing protein n=1 Tax=Novosphingobium album (ex Liu et al. 2023) TaxID=3031130 RepID=A0ABT5WUS7_9SPHN|nr:hypothetical protein [Novosphingobium album (ex Liu et al. 2023)]MDE8653629.1 hypothetical protein [Novosphingobium album (ex Liu et al. 2023)]
MVTETNSPDPAAQGQKPQTSTNVVALPVRPEPRPSDKVVAFVKQHPVLTIAGGLAVGAAAAALLNRRGTRKLAVRAFELAELAGTAALMLGRESWDKAETAGSGARRQAGIIAGQAEKLGEAAAHRAERLGASAWEKAGALGHAAREQSSRWIGYPRPAPSLGRRIAEKAVEFATRGRH